MAGLEANKIPPMPFSPLAAPNHSSPVDRRTTIVAWAVFAATTVVVTLLVRRQAILDTEDHVRTLERELRSTVARIDSRAASDDALRLDAIDRLFANPADRDSYRSLEDGHPGVDRIFLVEDRQVVWPPPIPPATSVPWREPRAIERKLLVDGYGYARARDEPSALVAFRAASRSSNLAIRFEALWNEAKILLNNQGEKDQGAEDQGAKHRSATRLKTIVAECQDALSGLTPEPLSRPVDRESIVRWSILALLEISSLDRRRGLAHNAAQSELAVLERLAATPAHEFFPGLDEYVDDVLARLPLSAPRRDSDRAPPSADTDGSSAGTRPDVSILTDTEQTRLDRARRDVLRSRSERAFRRRLEDRLLARIASLPTTPGDIKRFDELADDGIVSKNSTRIHVTFRRLPGSIDRVVGFTSSPEDVANAYESGLLPLLEASEENSAGRLVGPDGRTWRSLGEHDDAKPPRWVTSSTAYPFSVEWNIGPLETADRRARILRYGSLAGIALASVAVALAVSLRSIRRRLELAELKTQFVANVSHELKTPLTLIRMYSDLSRLGYAKSREDFERGLAIVARESETLELLIDNVLELSRMDAGAKSYSLGLEDLGPLTDEIVAEYGPYLESAGVAASVETQPDLPLVSIDRSAYSQCLRNLLSNAAKYSSDRREVEVRVERTQGDVTVTVADRGRGISSSECHRVFDRFYRVPSSADDTAAGTGLGLAIVRGIVEGHDGRVWASPREGGGTKFVLRFPGAKSPPR